MKGLFHFHTCCILGEADNNHPVLGGRGEYRFHLWTKGKYLFILLACTYKVSFLCWYFVSLGHSPIYVHEWNQEFVVATVTIPWNFHFNFNLIKLLQLRSRGLYFLSCLFHWSKAVLQIIQVIDVDKLLFNSFCGNVCL